MKNLPFSSPARSRADSFRTACTVRVNAIPIHNFNLYSSCDAVANFLFIYLFIRCSKLIDALCRKRDELICLEKSAKIQLKTWTIIQVNFVILRLFDQCISSHDGIFW